MSTNVSTNLFQPRLYTWRAILPPPLRGEDRARLVSRLVAAVRQQATLADQTAAVLRTTGRVEESGEYLLLEHEPAAPLIVTTDGLPPTGLDFESLQWLAAVGGLALAEAQRGGVAHGGVLPAAFHQNRAGLAELGDFGVAAALESVCGTDRRREIFLDPTPREIDGHAASGCWMLLHERERRNFGWIAPFFAHELLDGRVRLNPRGDRFALGVVLHHLATGRHPYHVDFSDPTLRLYFTLEPPPPEDERPDWREALKKSDGAAKSRERFLREWSQFEQRLCASESSQRWNEPDALAEACGQIAPPSWNDAARALRAGLRELDAGGPGAFLDAVTSSRQAGLPPAWRSRLDVLVRDVERTKADIEARGEVRRDLDAARRAIDDMDLAAAQRLAKAVIESPLAEPDQRAVAADVLVRCGELSKSVESGADQFARGYLESATDALSRGDVDDARQTLSFVINDPGTPPPRVAQARQLLADVEALAAVYERHEAELAAAERDRSAGHYDAAEARLVALLAEPKLRDSVASSATALREKVVELHTLRQEYATRLDEAQKAWERVDSDGLQAAIQAVPDEFVDPTITELRSELRARARTLAAALHTRDAAAASAEKGDIEGALRQANRISPHAVLPRILRDELNEQIRGWTGRLEAQRREAVAKATAALDAAEADYLEGRERDAVRSVESTVLSEIALPLEARDRAERLLERCRRAIDARRRLAEADAALSGGDLAAAARFAAEFDLAELTPTLLHDVEAFDTRLERAKHARLDQQRAEWRRRGEEHAAALAAGRLDEVESALKANSPPAELGPEIAQRWTKLGETLAINRSFATRIDAAEKRLHQSADGPALCNAELDKIPATAPPWVRERAAALRSEAIAIVETRRREEQARAAARRREIESGLQAMIAEVDSLTRQNRRVRGRIVNWSREGDLTEAQKASVASLLQRHDTLPDRRSVPWPLISSVGLVGMFAAGGIWWWLRAAPGTVPQPQQPPQPTPLVVNPTLPETQPTTREAPTVTTNDETPPKIVKNDEPAPTPPVEPEPTPTVEPPKPTGPTTETTSAYQDAIRNTLPTGVDVALEAAGDSKYRATVSGAPATLLPFDGIAWSIDASDFQPPAATVAAHFERQIAAVQAVADGSAAIRVDPAYDARMRWKTPAEKLEVRAVSDRGVEVRAKAELEGDPLSDRELILSGVVSGSEFVADGASKTAFENHLKSLRSAQLERFVVEEWLSGFRFAPPTGFAGGEAAVFGIVDAVGARVGTLATRWDADRLAFIADADAIAAARTAAIRSTLNAKATVDRLTTEWAGELRAALATINPVGGEYLARCVVVSITASAEQSPAGVPVSVRLAPEGAPYETLDIPLTLQAGESQLEWPPPSDEKLIASVAAALDARNQDGALRTRRRADVVAAIAREANVAADAVTIEPGDTTETVTALAGTPEPTRYTLAWNPAAFRYDIAEKTAPTPAVTPPTTAPTPPPETSSGIEAVLRARLERAATIDIAPADFAPLYADVVARKLERFGSADFRPRASLQSNPASAPLEIASAIQSLVAPSSATDRYPVVFVEYFVGEKDVYALAWRARTDGANAFSSIEGTRIWRVMPAAMLAGAADAGAVRRLFESPANGEALLGFALGANIEGSQPGDAGSYGVAVAPDGPLWLVRWDQVQFNPRPVSNIAKLKGGELPRSASRLRDLLSFQVVERTPEFRRVGIWCFPSLGGRFAGGNPPRLAIGLTGNNAQLRFTRGGRARSLLYARVEDSVGDESTWADLSGRLAPANIGYLFWNDGWTTPRDWSPRKTTSVALLLP